MKLFLFIVLAVLVAATAKASIIPASPIATTYALAAAPVATSYQVVARNVNRVIVPPASPLAYAGYAGAWGGYPYSYNRVGYGYGYDGYPYGHIHNYGYGYSYPYSYGATVW